jgi:hypothetical protein
MSAPSIRTAILVTGLLAVVAGCATPPDIDYDPKFDFAPVRTFRVSDEPVVKADDPRLDSPLLNQRIHTAIVSVLRERGYSIVEQGADLDVVFSIGSRVKVDSSGPQMSVGFGRYGTSGGVGVGYSTPTRVESYQEGVLTIDMIKPEADALIWRGSTSRRLSEGGSTPEKTTQSVNEVVAEILKSFPPGKK